MDANGKRDPWGSPAFEQAVRETAYFLWEQDGRPEGREEEYWFRALERSLRERNADGDIGRHPDTHGASRGDNHEP